jgi:GNAT superfamily N-acetyltransferase
MITVERFTDPAAYRSAVGPLLAADPVRGTIIATVTAGLVTAPDPENEPLLVAASVSGDVVAAALRTPPHPLTVLIDPGVGDRAGVARALAGAARDAGCRPRMLTGPRRDVTELGEALAVTGAVAVREQKPMLLYRLADLMEPVGVRGTGRPADLGDPADLELIAGWFHDFAIETGTVPVPTAPDPEAVRTREDRGARHLLWVVDDDPVALAGRSVVVDAMARIGPVYTPEPLRRHGFGAAVTAAAVRSAQHAGASEVVLFTDADYAPSNAVYRRLGFEVVDEFCELTLDLLERLQPG